MQHHAPFKCLGDLKPGCQCYYVCTQATITLVTALCPFQIAQEPCSARNLHPRPLHPPCRGQEGDRGDSWCRTTSGSFLHKENINFQQKWAPLGVQCTNNPKMYPGLLSYCCRFSHCPGSKEIAMHHFFWDALYHISYP